MTDTSLALRDRAWVEIDAAALRHNIQALQGLLSSPTQLMAVIKADAYGHGADQVAQIAAELGVKLFGVATVPEGIALRQARLTGQIILLSPAWTPHQFREMVQWRLEPTLSSIEQAHIAADAVQTPLPVHLKIDTGMARLGPLWTEAQAFVSDVQQLPNLAIASLYSHLATADETDLTFTREQKTRYDAVLKALPEGQVLRQHLANSAGTLCGPDFHYDWVRVGLALYGIYPGPQFQAAVDLRPVMQVYARITQIKMLPPHTGISYGHRYVTTHTQRIAVVSIGYADGVARRLSNQFEVLVRGQRVPQVGTITMDQFMIDVSNVSEVEVGDRVTLIGTDGTETITVEDWSTRLGTIPYEITCGFASRLPRCLINQ